MANSVQNAAHRSRRGLKAGSVPADIEAEAIFVLHVVLHDPQAFVIGAAGNRRMMLPCRSFVRNAGVSFEMKKSKIQKFLNIIGDNTTAIQMTKQYKG